MKRNKVYPVLLFILSLPLVLYLSFTIARADGPQPEAPESTFIEETEGDNVEAEVIEDGLFVSNVNVPEVASVTSLPPLLETVIRLNGGVIRDLTQPGWLYIEENTTITNDLGNSGVLDNGSVIPNQYKQEIWLHFDTQGLIDESVTIMRSPDGQVIQVGVFSKGLVWNTTTTEVGTRLPFALNDFDYGSLRELRDYAGTPQYTESLTVLDGQQVYLFTLEEVFSQPMESTEFSQPITRIVNKFYFDSVTGQFLEKEDVAHFTDGTLTTFNLIEIVMTANATPTTEVLSYLQ